MSLNMMIKNNYKHKVLEETIRLIMLVKNHLFQRMHTFCVMKDITYKKMLLKIQELIVKCLKN